MPMPVHYSFVTNWKLKASLEDVWNAVYDSLEWPQWWRGVQSVAEEQPNDETGVNGIRTYTWKSFLPYGIRFSLKLTEKEPLKRLKGIATGELEGTGEWHFTENNGIVHVRYDWNIVTNKKWMNTLAFLLKPVFRFNHNVVMHWGGKGLARKLGTRLLKG